MSINVSASSILDYLSCPKKVHYRLFHSEQAEQTVDMIVGNTIHTIAEKYWNKKEEANQFCLDTIKYYNLEPKKVQKLWLCYNNFFDFYAKDLSEDDKVEVKFKLELAKDIYLVGRIDRVHNNSVIDWKTSSITPRNIDNHVQFIVYNYAYKRLYNRTPDNVLYASLQKTGYIRFYENSYLTDYLFNDIIPVMISDIKSGKLVKKGRFTGECFSCSFRELCFSEDANVVDRAVVTKK